MTLWKYRVNWNFEERLYGLWNLTLLVYTQPVQADLVLLDYRLVENVGRGAFRKRESA